MIQIEKMSKLYQLGGETIKALDEVSLTIPEGDFVAIIGPSGSGKSTLMNMIGCLDIPTSGAYHFAGKDISKMNDNRLAEIRNQKIGFIFQGFNLLQKLTALENVELPLFYRGIAASKSREMALEALAKVGLKDRANHRPTELSGGQQQRVAIARALVGNPQILLADEPTGALDSKTGQEVLELLKGLNVMGHTIILITHDLDIASKATRVIRIHDGKLFEGGEVA